MKAKDAMKQNPPVDPRQALDNALLDAFRQSVSPEDVRAIMAKIVTNGREKGDVQAARFIHDMARAGQRKPSVSVRGDNNTVNINPTFISDTQRHILAILSGKGPLDAVALAGLLHCDKLHVHEALDHDWFDRGAKGKYALTPAGLKEAKLLGEAEDG